MNLLKCLFSAVLVVLLFYESEIKAAQNIQAQTQVQAHTKTQIQLKAQQAQSQAEAQAEVGTSTKWNGYNRFDFKFKDRAVTVVCPDTALNGRAWIWRPAFFNAFPSVDIQLLKEGFHVVYYDVTHMYGSPRGVALGTEFYNYITDRYNLSSKVTLEGFSRGGLYALNWAIANPEKVACIYIDNPVCNIFSWPGKESKLWSDLLREWDAEQIDQSSYKYLPADNLQPLAKAGIPIMGVCGDSDKVVPFEQNMATVRDNYVKLGGAVELIMKPGADHHPHSLEKPEPIIDFILRNQPGYQQYQHISPRGSLTNSFVKFEHERKARVAFLGGSITEMTGWRDMIKGSLKQRFPNTEFEFVDAGISSTGTTPHAFRVANDVLSKGKIDLLFVEAAVNDHTNGFTATEQVRGMEGVVRHVLNANPETDIVMLHFVYDPFIEMIRGGQTPDVILNHERVANHYMIPSINLAQEVIERISDGQFTWEKFGGTHPAWFGHKFYAAAINRLFDQMWGCCDLPKYDLSADKNRQVNTANAKIVKHGIPREMLDSFCYDNGYFVDIRQAKTDKNWKIAPEWKPSDKTNTRKGFVNVPMLTSNTPGATLSLTFRGKAVGIFCVCGPSSAILEYSVDGAKFKTLDTYTQWSKGLYLPWAYTFETELDPEKEHKLVVRIASQKNAKSKGNECVIRNFIVN